MKQELKKTKVLSINITIGSYRKILEGIDEIVKNEINSFIVVSNVHMVIEAYNNPNFKAMLDDSIIATSDGMPLVLFNRYINKVEQDRAAGMDLLPDLLEISSQKKYKVLFYGGAQAMLNSLEQKVTGSHPLIEGKYYAPPFRELSEDEVEDIDKMILDFNPNIIFVCLGCPKQEKWMYNNYKKFNAVMLGVGGAVPVYAGVVERAPIWMQKLSLEWFFRLMKEPKRLLKRYLYTNSKFLWLTLRYLIFK
jgi:N-acetylglucosaminyldiphosphoundecaprenol N-acetyl-beta-D-mannosaminyltransferase